MNYTGLNQALVADSPAVKNDQERFLRMAVTLRGQVVLIRRACREHAGASKEDGGEHPIN